MWPLLLLGAGVAGYLLYKQAAPSHKTRTFTPGIWQFNADVTPVPTVAGIDSFIELMKKAGKPVRHTRVDSGKLTVVYDSQIAETTTVTFPQILTIEKDGQIFNMRIYSANRVG